jgi:hypothetical protein
MLSIEQIAAIICAEMGVPDDKYPGADNAAEKIHDLVKPDHTIHVAAAAMENEVTDTLIDMLVVTVLAKLIDQEGGGRTNFAFSPMDMAAVMKEWDYIVERDGMVRTVRIQPKNNAEWEEGDGGLLQHSGLARAMGLAEQDVAPPPIGDLDSVKPQAVPHEYKRPLWFIRYSPAIPEGEEDQGVMALDPVSSKIDGQRQLRSYSIGALAHVENRWCEHLECPSTGCTYDASKRDGAEATSDLTG